MGSVEAALAAPVGYEALNSVEVALPHLEGAAASGRTPGERAILAGRASDRVAFAVIGGYDAALRRLLFPKELPRACFCVTEGLGGAHPRSIQTRLEERLDDEGRVSWVVTGTKTFATLASHAEWYVVVASAGHGSDGRNLLRAVLVKRGAPGVVIETRAPLPFTPELPHGKLELTLAPVSSLLGGDGYDNYVKPFRTVEDLHVTLAILGYAFAEASRCGWASEGLTSSLRTLLNLADEADAKSPTTHLAVDVELHRARASLDALPWAEAPTSVSERWFRDRPILEVAARVREQRTAKARAIIG